MKVLIVTTVYDNSIVGAGTFIHALSKHLTNVHILSENVEDSKNSTKVNLHLNLIQQKIGSSARIKPYQKALYKIHDEYDIVFFNSPILAYKLPFELSKKVIFVHDYENTSLSFRSLKYFILSFWNRHIESSSLRSCANIITNSDYTKSKLVSAYQLVESHVTVCHLGIDVALFPFRSKTKFSSPIKVLFIKEDYKRGGLYILIEALNMLSDYKFELSLVGFDSSLLKLKSNAHIKINPIGKVKNSTIASLLNDHDIYSVPSLREALGLGNMEAMSAGIPVVATDAGGIPEVIDNSCGWIAKANDTFSLMKQIKMCIENTTERQQKSKNARAKVQNFDIKSVVKKLESVLCLIIEK